MSKEVIMYQSNYNTTIFEDKSSVELYDGIIENRKIALEAKKKIADLKTSCNHSEIINTKTVTRYEDVGDYPDNHAIPYEHTTASCRVCGSSLILSQTGQIYRSW